MPGSTPKGVPYILGTDAAADIDTQMQALAEWVDDNPGTAAMTTATRDALAGGDLWTGRTIFNTARGTFEYYNGAAWQNMILQIVAPADLNVSPADYPEGMSLAAFSGAVAGGPSGMGPSMVTTFRYGNTAIRQVLSSRDATPTDASYPTWERLGYVAGTPEWGPWALITPSTKTVRIPHTWHVPGEVKVASGDIDFILPMFQQTLGASSMSLALVRYKINSGTSATFKMQQNGVDLAGFTGIVAGTSAGVTDPADVALTSAAALAPVVTAVSGTPKNLAITAFIDYTF